MIGEHDTVVLTRDVPEYGLEKGDVGAIVYRYESRHAHEVEFVTAEGRTIAVLTLTKEDVRLMCDDEIPHARGLAIQKR